MISKIQGILESVDNGKAYITTDSPFTYEVLVNGFTQTRLAPKSGQTISLHTIHFLEGSSQGSSFIPRLAGFLTETDREFFELFTTVKGIGPRKALRCITLDISYIADAIADRDSKLLQSLPEIGKRMAETVIVTLYGKVDRFVSSAAYPSTGAATQADQLSSFSATSPAREALEILLQLGENRSSAIQWIDQALARNPDIIDSQVLLADVFRIKGSM